MNRPTDKALAADLETIRTRMTIAYIPEHFTDAQQLTLLDRMVKLRRIELGIRDDEPRPIVPPISAAAQ